MEKLMDKTINKINKYLNKNNLNEGMWSSIIDDIMRKMTSRVTGKEHAKRIAITYISEYLRTLSLMKTIKDEDLPRFRDVITKGIPGISKALKSVKDIKE